MNVLLQEAIEAGWKPPGPEPLYCPISVFRIEGGWICEAYHDGGNHYVSVFSNIEQEAVDFAKRVVSRMVDESDCFSSVEFDQDQSLIHLGPFRKTADEADVKILFKDDEE